MILLLVITASAWCAVGASFGYLLGHRHGSRYEINRRDYEIRLMKDLYDQPAYGDD